MIKRPSLAILLALVVFLAASGLAQAGTSGLTPCETRVVAEVVDGDTLVLDRPVDGARQVRLVGLQAPKLPLGRAGFPVWPQAAQSKQALAKLVLGKTVRLSYGGLRMDRHRRRLAHLHTADGAWVQGAMLRAGMARVYSFSDNRTMVGEMLAIESEARAARRGIWADPFYAVRSPAEASRHIDTFQLVEGKVLDAAQVRGRVYLNFGLDWRSDFTATLDRRALRLLKTARIDPLAYEGRWLRLRGWLKSLNGPMIDLTHPEQIKILAR